MRSFCTITAAIVQRAARVEKSKSAGRRRSRASSRTPLSTNVRKPDVALQHDERARLSLSKPAEGQQDFVDGLRPLEPPAEPALAADARQRPPDFGLEQDDDGDRGVGNDVREQRPQRLESGPYRNARRSQPW